MVTIEHVYLVSKASCDPEPYPIHRGEGSDQPLPDSISLEEARSVTSSQENITPHINEERIRAHLPPALLPYVSQLRLLDQHSKKRYRKALEQRKSTPKIHGRQSLKPQATSVDPIRHSQQHRHQRYFDTIGAGQSTYSLEAYEEQLRQLEARNKEKLAEARREQQNVAYFGGVGTSAWLERSKPSASPSQPDNLQGYFDPLIMSQRQHDREAYEQQLRLLEAQNKERLATARAERERMPPAYWGMNSLPQIPSTGSTSGAANGDKHTAMEGKETNRYLAEQAENLQVHKQHSTQSREWAKEQNEAMGREDSSTMKPVLARSTSGAEARTHYLDEYESQLRVLDKRNVTQDEIGDQRDKERENRDQDREEQQNKETS